MNWKELFILDLPVLEIFVRGSITYLALFAMLRFVLKREAGAVGVTDLLLIVLIADAAQDAMAGGYTSITAGLILVGTILFWSFFLNWAGSRTPFMNRLLRPPPLLLVEDGKIIRENMRRELLTKDELMSEIRQAGLEDIQDVAKVYMEGDGTFSVIRKDHQDVSKNKDKEKKKTA